MSGWADAVRAVPVADRWLVAALAATAAVEAAVTDGGDLSRLLPDLVVGCGVQLLLLLRRRHPLAAMTAYAGSALVGTVLQALVSPELGGGAFAAIVALVVLAFSLGAYGDARAVALGTPQPVIVVVVVDLLDPSQGPLTAAVPFFALFVVGVPVLVGRLARGRRTLTEQVQREETELASGHEQAMRLARARESLALSDRLAATLDGGLAGLLADVRALPGQPSADEVARVEETARRLLGTTRETVVELTREPAGRPPDVPAEEVPVGEVVQPWAALVAAAVGVGLVVELRAPWSSLPWGVVLSATLVTGLALVWRHPLPATVVVWLAAVGLDRFVVPWGSSLTGIGVVVGAGFLVGWASRRRPAVVGLLVCAAGAVAAMGLADVGGRLAFLALAWTAAVLVHDHTVLLHHARATHERHQLARAAELDALVLEERAAAARDLHDALGHSLTVVSLQAGAARRLAALDPDRSASALAVVERVIAAGLADLRAGLGARWDLAALVDAGRAAGHRVRVVGTPPPTVLQPVCQRVLQESFTNLIRHAPGAEVCVVLEPTPDRFRVLVENGPGGPPGAYDGGGAGLAGMRDRVLALGGILTWGPTATGGFAVQADLPLVQGATA